MRHPILVCILFRFSLIQLYAPRTWKWMNMELMKVETTHDRWAHLLKGVSATTLDLTELQNEMVLLSLWLRRWSHGHQLRVLRSFSTQWFGFFKRDCFQDASFDCKQMRCLLKRIDKIVKLNRAVKIRRPFAFRNLRAEDWRN